MPHVIIECTENIFPGKPEELLVNAAHTLAEIGPFKPMQIKSRIIPIKHSALGYDIENHAFIAAEIVLLDNKPPEKLEDLSEGIQKVLLQYSEGLEMKTSVTTPITLADESLYKKDTNFKIT